MKRLIILSMTACLLTGCGIYKNYSRPDMEIEAQYRHTKNIADTAAIASLSWREFFADTCLQALIEQGVQRNTDLQMAYLRVEEAEAVLMNARLSYLPSLSLLSEAGVSRYAETTSKTYNIATSASWELDIFGKNTNAKRGASAALEGSSDYAQAVQTQLIAAIADSYYTLLMLDSQLKIGEQTLESWEKSIRILESVKRGGKSDDAAVLQARANRMTLEISVLALRKSIVDTENSLSALLAMPSRRIERGTLSETAFPESVSTGIPVQLLANRPDVRQAERNLAQAFYATNAARAAFYPSITLAGTSGWTNNGGGVILNLGQWLLNAIGSLTQSLFNKGTNMVNLRIAESRQEQATLQFRQSLLDAGKEVNDALVQCQTSKWQIELGEQQITTLTEAVRKTELLMLHSSTTYLEVLTAQQALLNAEQQQSQYRFDNIQGFINLYHALGGGI